MLASLCAQRLRNFLIDDYMKRFYILLIICIAGSCTKNNGSASDKELPVIQLLLPANNQVFTAGQPVNINGLITDNGKLAEVHVHIYNNGTGQLLIDINRFPDTGSYTLDETFQSVAGIQYKIQLVAIDKAANQQVTTVFVTVS
jgi:hypothetical protein